MQCNCHSNMGEESQRTEHNFNSFLLSTKDISSPRSVCESLYREHHVSNQHWVA